MIIGVTGHRPPKLFKTRPYSAMNTSKLEAFARDFVETYKPTHVITGMALGWDLAVARACYDAGIPFSAFIPFKGQESTWPEASQENYNFLLSKATRLFYVSEPPYSAAKMFLRDEWIVREADLMVALFDGKDEGGTAHTVNYSDANSVPVDNLWDNWIKHRDGLVEEIKLPESTPEENDEAARLAREALGRPELKKIDDNTTNNSDSDSTE